MKRLLLEIEKMKLLVQEPDKLKKRVNQSKKTHIVAVRKSSRLKNKINFFFNFIQFIFAVRRIFVRLCVFLCVFGKNKNF
jgi:hypothetical protein